MSQGCPHLIEGLHCTAITVYTVNNHIALFISLSWCSCIQFPSSTDNDAISVACLDLGYSITCTTDTSQKQQKPVIESSLLLMDEHATKATFDSLPNSFCSEDGTVAPSGIYEPSIEEMDKENSAHHISRTPAQRYERLKRGANTTI